MRLISQATKETIVKKALNRGNTSLHDIAKENNVSYPSITKWIRQYKNNELKTTTTVFSNSVNSKSAQLEHIIATASLDDKVLGVYCRERGLYAHQIEKWKADLMKQDNSSQGNQVLLTEMKALRSEIKSLKQDIRRKDRALAEAAALLILKKKAEALWGDQEDV